MPPYTIAVGELPKGSPPGSIPTSAHPSGFQALADDLDLSRPQPRSRPLRPDRFSGPLLRRGGIGWLLDQPGPRPLVRRPPQAAVDARQLDLRPRLDRPVCLDGRLRLARLAAEGVRRSTA